MVEANEPTSASSQTFLYIDEELVAQAGPKIIELLKCLQKFIEKINSERQSQKSLSFFSFNPQAREIAAENCLKRELIKINAQHIIFVNNEPTLNLKPDRFHIIVIELDEALRAYVVACKVDTSLACLLRDQLKLPSPLSVENFCEWVKNLKPDTFLLTPRQG